MAYLNRTVIVALCSAAIFAGCSDRPIVVNSQQFASPDAKSIATLETVDNGLGFGLGALYEEVHINRPHEAIVQHGDADNSVVFYVESNYGKGKPVTVKWLADDRVRISYDKLVAPGKRIARVNGISIEYVTYATYANSTSEP